MSFINQKAGTFSRLKMLKPLSVNALIFNQQALVDRHTLNGALDVRCGPGGKCGPGGEKKTPRNKKSIAQF
ncbi:hypothetical protein AFK68_08645 [Hydrocoleum sp. CS-953]|uniref:hypothetical protein n=1 Tax=Hydrocoleum sp. CS-953 TaxID=1671698 RepID=UPI000B9B10E0|nr:hypothetical protein [Hydrocoleum sp. CS-953]OZH54799.1 hypothetical protein AFK68_08645 [Hydrocoleum sp. CS-953]